MSFTIANMPEDMMHILQKYPAGEKYKTFYDFFIANTDRVVLCPNIRVWTKSSNSVVSGLTHPDLDDSLYFGERSVYLNTFYENQRWNSIIIILSVAVHENTHLCADRLFGAKKIAPELFYSETHNERDAHIMEEKFLKFAAQDPEFANENIFRQLASVANKIERYNSILGLPRGDRTLLLLE